MTKDEQIERIIAQEIYCLANELGEHACKSESFFDDFRNIESQVCTHCHEEIPNHTDGDPCPHCKAEETEVEFEPREIMQWWIVSEWLAEKLADMGQPIGEHLGLHVWGRLGCGYALTEEGCIKELAANIATE